MQIRIKPELVSLNEGFDFVGRPNSSKAVHSKVAELQNQHWMCIRENKQKGIFVYWKEKHRKKTIVQQTLTKTGKVSKKTTTKTVPTHWKYKIWFIPDVIIQLLKQDSKFVCQRKDYWEIVSVKK